MAKCDLKFDECRSCVNFHDVDVCDECDSGELFEENDGLDFDGERDYD